MVPYETVKLLKWAKNGRTVGITIASHQTDNLMLD